jgi:Dolichyl-phosphate-mannose-protein mannosyltransferase
MRPSAAIPSSPASPAPVSLTRERPYATWALLALVVLVGYLVREWRLEAPAVRYFDETYYVKAAYEYLEGKPDSNTVHPPLGKMCIAAGIWLYQTVAPSLHQLGWIDRVHDSAGWRLSSLLAGTLMLPLTYMLGSRLFNKPRVGLLAAYLLAFDPLHITQSRIAMLDMVLSLCILGAAWAAWRFIEAEEAAETRWALVSVVLFSLGAACKWNSLFAAAGAVPAMLLLKPWAWRKRLGWVLKLGVMYAVLLPTIYMSSFAYHFYHAGTMAQVGANHKLMVEFRYGKQFTHRYMSNFWAWPTIAKPVWYHYEDTATPTDCLFPNRNDTALTRLMWQGDDPGMYVVGVIAIGSPFTWITFLIFYVLTLGQSLVFPLLTAVSGNGSSGATSSAQGPVRMAGEPVAAPALEPEAAPEQAPSAGQGEQAMAAVAAPAPAGDQGLAIGAASSGPDGQAAGLVGRILALLQGPERPWIFLVLLYTPQVLLWSVNKGFLFYMLPCTPFMAIMAGAVLEEWEELPLGRSCIMLYLATATLCTMAYYPLLTAYPLPKPLYHILIPFSKWI